MSEAARKQAVDDLKDRTGNTESESSEAEPEPAASTSAQVAAYGH